MEEDSDLALDDPCAATPQVFLERCWEIRWAVPTPTPNSLEIARQDAPEARRVSNRFWLKNMGGRPSRFPLARALRMPAKGCRLCLLSAKRTRLNWDSAVPDLLRDIWKQQLAALGERATQMLQLGGVSILLLFQVP
jgi:hypothetical protein